jgi:galactokinase
MSEGLAGRIDRTIATLDHWRDPAEAPTWAFFVPGRIEVLGKHTDYAGGRSIVAATEQGLCLAVRPREDGLLRIADLTRGMEIGFEIEPGLEPTRGHWSNYPQTVARRLLKNFPPRLRGADVAFTSDLPRAAGMSSSSALVVSVYLVLAKVNDLMGRPEYRDSIGSPEELGEYLGAVENGLDFRGLEGGAGVGTFGGSEDQTAILCSRHGELQQYSYCPVRHERSLRLPEDHCFVVAVSGVHASKTGGVLELYNRASMLASEAAAVWRRATGLDDPHLAAVLERGADVAEEMRRALRSTPSETFTSEQLLGRFEQFRMESTEILPAAGDALESGDLEAFGAAVDRSQVAVEEFLGNQIEETSALAAAARRLGAAAASAFGAGFGGSVWALVPRGESEVFRTRWRADYLGRFPQHERRARFIETGAAAAARELDLDGGSE